MIPNGLQVGGQVFTQFGIILYLFADFVDHIHDTIQVLSIPNTYVQVDSRPVPRHVHHDPATVGRLVQALCSIHSVKAAAIGAGGSPFGLGRTVC